MDKIKLNLRAEIDAIMLEQGAYKRDIRTCIEIKSLPTKKLIIESWLD